MTDIYREPIDEKAEVPVAPSPVHPKMQEILELERQLAEKRAMLSPESAKTLEQQIKPEQAAFKSASVSAPSLTIASPSPQEVKQVAGAFKGLEKNQQLKGLVDLAFQKGVIYASEVVRNIDNPYLIDEFHDTLADHLRQELIEKGKLEEL